MRNLIMSLRESDAAVLEVLAGVWKVDIDGMTTNDIATALYEAMQDGKNTERVWERLNDEQRGALQTLVGSGGKMSLPMFKRIYGDIRKLGRGALQREKPQTNPQSIGEALFYHGLLYEGYEQARAGAQVIVYVPEDLIALLPTHRTTYDGLEDQPVPQTAAATGAKPADDVPFDDDDAPTIDPLDPDMLDEIHQADTSIIDDLTTLLSYLRIKTAKLERDNEVLVLSMPDLQAISPHLLVKDDDRLSFLLELAISADLIEVSEGKAFTRRTEVRRWLEASRSGQLKILADTWHTGTLYRELWHVPGLHPEAGGWAYDPSVARAALLGFMRDYVPRQEWWSIDEFIFTVKESEPDFQRPGGDYESWYIRNDQGDYLNGYESWDAIEGALLEFYLMGPLHWLGMVDLAEDAARLNAYGRAFVTQQPMPNPNIEPEKILIREDGTLLASRRVASMDRFQLARFTAWDQPATTDGTPYGYRLTGQSIKQADEQGINTGHIAAFLTRFVDGGALPPQITKLLETWQTGASSSVTLERLLVLRTTAPEVLDRIVNTPALRRYTGARLGQTAVVVRADQWEELRDALGVEGIDVEVID